MKRLMLPRRQKRGTIHCRVPVLFQHWPRQRGRVILNEKDRCGGVLSVKGIQAMRKFTTILPLMLFLFSAGASGPQDGFSGIRCGADIPKALIGRFMRNERVVVIENRHKDLGLKDLGGTDISERPPLFASSWKICGDEYMLLEDGHSVVRDVLKVPEHSKRSPEFIGECQNNGAKMPGTIVAILNNEEGKAILSAKAAWKVDKKSARFIKISTEGLGCPRSGIITADGGQ